MLQLSLAFLRPQIAKVSQSRGSSFSKKNSNLRVLSTSSIKELDRIDDNFKKMPFYITTPIYYVNDIPHIGHAYTTVACDVLARWHRLQGREVRFLTGTDEHGLKVEEAAKKAGISPQHFVDQLSETFKQLTKTMNISNDMFVRTTSASHQKAVVEMWQRLVKNDQIYLGAYEGWYSVRDECYYAESELINGKAPTGATVEWVNKEPSYFFKLSQWQQPLLDFYNKHPDFICPKSRRNEVVSFVESGLKDLSISRTKFTWGVPVPMSDEHVVYVWVDALTNYLTGLGWPSSSSNSFNKFWPSPHTESEVVHIIGKDILRFHAVYWPALLMAADIPLPTKIFAHGFSSSSSSSHFSCPSPPQRFSWWTRDGKKISKSVGNTIDPSELCDVFGVDAVRYFLMSEVPLGKDGDYSQERMLATCNGFLANGLGNLQMRVVSLIDKNCDGEIPNCLSSPLHPSDEKLLQQTTSLPEAMHHFMSKQSIHEASLLLESLVRDGNKYIDAEAPWVLKKTDPDRMKTVLFVLSQVLEHVGICGLPFMPKSCELMLSQLGFRSKDHSFEYLSSLQLPSKTTKSSKKVPRNLKPVFPRVILES